MTRRAFGIAMISSENRPIRKAHKAGSNSVLNLTEDSILKMADHKDIWVEAYGDRYSRMRKTVKRLVRLGKLKLVAEFENGSYYSTTAEGHSAAITVKLKEAFKEAAKDGRI